ncbi:MAG: NADH-quinone oxidoreductase subunit NuoH [Acidobacteria bacterium]|nr:NADH-quinone oxidoreductase subunit NuoH [Acidobacteriota bacterium]
MNILVNYVVIPLVKIVVIVAILSGGIAYLTLMERKVIARLQHRLGPMRVGWHGILQPIADGLKFIIKEDIIPIKADRFVFTIAPGISLVPAFIVFSVIPFGPPDSLWGTGGYVTDVNIALLFAVAVSSVGVLGVILGGWASNSKYPLLGALRSSAQMVSYEVAMGFGIIGVLLVANSLSLVEIVEKQRSMGVWFFFVQPIAFLIYYFCGMAETNRLPFDLPEAETELVGGFHTEYSGFRFSLFFIAEYANMITVSSLAVTLFFGGWLRPFSSVAALSFLDIIPPPLWFVIKVLIFLYIFIWVRGTLPRFRFDQLMRIGWKVFLPVAMANVMVTGAILLKFL